MPGQKLHHQQLSERLGVSRTPVREALTRLVQEGYVSFLPNRGFTCKEIRIQEAEELYDLRESLEAFAVEKAVEKLTDQALAELRQRLDLYGHDVQNRFTRERLVYDQDVHLHIAQIAGNETLKNTLSHVFERIVLKRRTDGIYDPARGLTAHQEHTELLEAMLRRDAAHRRRHHAQPYPSRQEKCHCRPAPAPSDPRAPARGINLGPKTNRRKGELWQQI